MMHGQKNIKLEVKLWHAVLKTPFILNFRTEINKLETV